MPTVAGWSKGFHCRQGSSRRHVFRNSFLHFPPRCAMAALAIKTRAAEIRESGAYLGIFEWLAWGVLSDASVQMLFGTNVVELGPFMGPNLPRPSGGRIHRVAAVRMQDGIWYTAGAESLTDVNHFVIGVPSGLPPSVASSSASSSSSSATSVLAARAALSVGWLLKASNGYGDCGPDCMAFSSSRPRTPESFRAIRNELADFLVGVSEVPVWQEAFALCGEGFAPEPPEPSGGLGPEPSGGLGPLVSGAPPSPSPSTPPPLPPPSPSTFQAWLLELTPEKRRDATATYSSFKAAETDWLASLPPKASDSGPAVARKHHASTTLRFRLATGKAYSEWLAGLGRASRSPLKVVTSLPMVPLGQFSRWARKNVWGRTSQMRSVC